MRDLGAPVVAVLVNWNGASDTLETLDSLAATESPPRILVVDNGSTDDSVARLRERWPDLLIVETGENLGFAGGNLAGIRRALEDPAVGFVLLINTDVEVAPDFLEPLVVACADPEVGATGPKIFYAEPRDRLWAAGGRLRLRETVTEEWGRGELDGPKWSTPRDVTYLTTCCLLIPRDALEKVGPLDPAYFINVDDADWCRRALDAGYRLRYEPSSVLWHKVAASTDGSYTPFKTFHTGRSNAIFVRKHHGFFGRLVFLGWNLVALAAAFFREAPKGNARAVWRKARGLWNGLQMSLPEVPRI